MRIQPTSVNPTERSAKFDTMVRTLTAKNLLMWQSLPEDEPRFSRRFTLGEQSQNERIIGEQFANIPASVAVLESALDSDRIFNVQQVRRSVIGSSILPDDGVSGIFFEKSEQVTRRFAERAVEFDPAITDTDIHQALRNLWVFNVIQMTLGLEIRLTPSSFAYSMLYPCTDNGLDSTSRTPNEKRAYVRWLSAWFERGPCASFDDWTEQTAGLLEMIEEEYPRSEFGDVQSSLQAIHRAQMKSLLLHANQPEEDEERLTAITIEKGGTSVLADGFLAAGRLSDDQADAIFEYGVVLQLIDDLRDIDEDRIAGHSTPFLRIAECEELDRATRQLLHFVNDCSRRLAALDSRHGVQVQEMIERGCTFLILEAAARHHDFFSKRFLRKVEHVMPLRPAFMREMYREIKTHQSQNVVSARLRRA